MNITSDLYSIIKGHSNLIMMNIKDPAGISKSFGRMMRSRGNHSESLQPVTPFHVLSTLRTINSCTWMDGLGSRD